MSRISYSEEEDWPGQFELWRANTERSLRGRGGQRALRELEAALIALPEKRLIAGHLAKDGMVCTVGALVVEKKVSLGQAREQVLAEFQAEYEGAMGCTCFHRRDEHGDGTGPCRVCADDRRSGWAYARECDAFTDVGYQDDDEDETGTTEEAGVAIGIPRMVAWRLVELNDMDLGRVSEGERYERVLAWVRRHLREAVPA